MSQKPARARRHRRRHQLPPAAVLVGSYLLGAVPVAQVAAKALRGVDLRDVGNGTVSGSGLYEVAGFRPLAVAGCIELAKGATGPLLAGRDRRGLGGLAAAAAIAGHNWSPVLRFRGGRGISLGMGALAVVAPEGTALLGAGMGIGKMVRETGLVSFAAVAGLPLVLAGTRGRKGRTTGLCIAVPILVKRLLGNAPAPQGSGSRVYVNRLLFDNDRHWRRE